MPTALTSVLRRLIATSFFTRDPARQSALQIVTWWELRRLGFNVIVGAAGLASTLITFVAVLFVAASQDRNADMDGAFFLGLLAVAYGVTANVCFTFGWIVELVLVRKLWPEEGRHFGPISFALGLIFSVLLTFSPAVLMSVFAAFALVSTPAQNH